MKNQKRWMAASGACGLLFFLIANCTDVFHGLSIAAAMLQISVNAFVFITWGRAFLSAKGIKRFVAAFGVVMPIILGSITIVRILIPWLFRIQ